MRLLIDGHSFVDREYNRLSLVLKEGDDYLYYLSLPHWLMRDRGRNIRSNEDFDKYDTLD